MAVTLKVNNISFEYPEQGEQQPWGEAATGWASEVTDLLASFKNEADILETTVSILNNQSTLANVLGLSFDSNTVRAFAMEAVIIRPYTGSSKYEKVILNGLNTETGGWILEQESIGDDSGVEFSITVGGQVQYTSTSLSGGTSGTIKYQAKTVLK